MQRKHLAKFLRESPSLRPELQELLADAYDAARIEAANESGIELDTFTDTCERTDAEVLDPPSKIGGRIHRYSCGLAETEIGRARTPAFLKSRPLSQL